MKKLFYFLLLTMFSTTGMAQRMILSGTWKLNNEKSTLFDQYTLAPGQLILIQTADSLLLEKHGIFQGQDYVFKNKFSFDGKECRNPGRMGSKKISAAVWSEDGKILTISSKVSSPDMGESNLKEVYRMEGKNLKVMVDASSPMGSMSETYLLDKQ